MDIRNMNTLIEGAESTETPSLDIKGACSWDRSLVKDLLAFANVQDGGHIIIGIEDRTFRRVGLTREQIDSFEEETMRDVMKNYATPFVDFRVFKDIVDDDGKQYVVIQIQEFSDTPVICHRTDGEVHAGKIYYRSKTGRVASAPVDNSHDMEDILNRAAVKMMQKRLAQGFTVDGAVNTSALDAELGEL